MSLKRKAGEAATDASKKPKANGSITAFFGAPKPAANSKAAAAAKFDREAWVAKLTEEQKDLLKLELETLHESWLPHLKDVLLTPQFLDLKRFLKQELKSGKTIYPPMKDVYSWYVSVTLTILWTRTHGRTGHDIRLLILSKSSSQAKTLTTVLTKHMAFVSLSAHLHPLHPHSRTSTKLSRSTTQTTSLQQTRAVS
jgi:hypothetical protein